VLTWFLQESAARFCMPWDGGPATFWLFMGVCTHDCVTGFVLLRLVKPH